MRTIRPHPGLRSLAAALGAAFALGCATPVSAPPVLVVTNALGRSVESIQHKGCSEPEVGFAPLEDSKVRAGQTRRFALSQVCIYLMALDARGRIVGEQRGLHTENGARWTLRR